ncbi:MAG: phosphoribosylanthranilate isomerase [Oscillospiraceae bacterium]
MKIKLCGVKNLCEIEMMNEFLPDYVGFVLAKSQREISAEKAKILCSNLDKKIRSVGVFVNENIEEIAKKARIIGLDVVQLHADETEDYIKKLRRILPEIEIWKAVRVSRVEDILAGENLSCDKILFDSFSKKSVGGTGKLIDQKLLKQCKSERDFFLAGGLNSENILEIINEINPYGVDISSGIETNGSKDREKIEKIMRCLECLR